MTDTKTEHFELSASGSSTWLNCPGAIQACRGYPNESSFFANEGTLAHGIADLCLENIINADGFVGNTIDLVLKTYPAFKSTYEKIKVHFDKSHVIDKSMCDFIQEYIDYVRSYENDQTELYTEKRVGFSNVVEGGFGTMDAAVVDPKNRVCHIFDLKFGMNLVYAEENTQAQMYAIGLYNMIGWLNEFDTYKVHIVQPRKYHFDCWDLSVEKMKEFAAYAKTRADLALSDNAPRIAGTKQCTWCKANGDCKAYADFATEDLRSDFDFEEVKSSDSLTDQQRKNILDKEKDILKLISSVKSYVYDKLQQGEDFEGYKLVESKPNRVFLDKAEKILARVLKDDAYNKKLIGLGEAEKKINKKFVNRLTYTPPGNEILVPSSDKRKAINKKPVKEEFDFEDIMGDL